MLFDTGDQEKKGRGEFCFAESEGCLLGINKGKLSILQKELLNEGNHKDFYVLESVLKGNYLIKRNWRKGEHQNQHILEDIEGITMLTEEKQLKLVTS